MLYGLEIAALVKRQEAELEVADMKMLKFPHGVTLSKKIKNELIRDTAHVRQLKIKLRESWLRWFDHVLIREEDCI